jgi:hypothetical protein
MNIKIFWQSARFFQRPGLYLKINNARFRVIPWPRF